MAPFNPFFSWQVILELNNTQLYHTQKYPPPGPDFTPSNRNHKSRPASPISENKVGIMSFQHYSYLIFNDLQWLDVVLRRWRYRFS